MASFRKNAIGKWEVQVARKGIRRAGTFETKAEATRWANSVESELMGGKKGAADKTFADLMNRFRDEHILKNKNCSMNESYRIDSILDDPIATVRLKDLDQTHFADWKKRRSGGYDGRKPVSDGTVLRQMGTISGALNHAISEWKWLDVNPMKGVKRPPAPAPRDRRTTQDEIDRIILASGYEYDEKPESVSARACACMLFAHETAMRAQEIAGLTMDRVFLDRKVAHLRAVDTKTKKKRDVPLLPEAIRLIRQMDVTEGRVFGVTSHQISTSFGDLTEKAMIEHLTFHDSRHEAITRLATVRKMDVMDLARMAGITNLPELMTYYNRSAEDVAKDW